MKVFSRNLQGIPNFELKLSIMSLKTRLIMENMDENSMKDIQNLIQQINAFYEQDIIAMASAKNVY